MIIFKFAFKSVFKSKSKKISLALVLFFFIVLSVCNFFCDQSWDITKNKQNSLSSASFELFEKIQEPIKISLFASLSASGNLPKVEKLMRKNIEFLQKYANASKDKIQLEILNVEKFSDLENQAIKLGFIGLNTDEIYQKIYFAWCLEFAKNSYCLPNSKKTTGAYSLTDLLQKGEKNLEYQLAEDILAILNTKKLKLGVLSAIDFLPSFNFQTAQKIPANPAYFALNKKFEIIDLSIDPQAPVDFLLVIGLNFLPYEDFLLAQKLIEKNLPTILILDSQQLDRQVQNFSQNKNLADFLQNFGILWHSSQMQDFSASQEVITNFGDLSISPDFILLKKDNFASSPILKNLNSILVATSSSFSFVENPNYKFTSLIKFSQSAKFKNFANIENSNSASTPNSEKLSASQGFKNTKYLAGILETDNSKAADLDLKPEIRLALIGDADFLNPSFWLRKNSASSASEYLLSYSNIFRDNLFFVQNLLDFFAEDNILLNLRNKEKLFLPFAKLEEIRKKAREKYFSKIQKLELKLQKIELQLGLLNREILQKNINRTDGNLDFENIEITQIQSKQNRLLEERERVANEFLQLREKMQESEKNLKNRVEFFMVYFTPLILSGALVIFWIIWFFWQKGLCAFLNLCKK